VTALGADQLVIDATGNQPQFAKNNVWFAEAIVAGGAFAAIAGFAALVAVHALDGGIRRRPKDAAELTFRTNGNARVHTHVADFARVITEQRLARASGAAAGAGITVVVPAAFLANAGAAEQAGGTVGRACAAIGRVFLQVDAFAVTAGQAVSAIGQTRATEPHRDADAVAAFFRLGIATFRAANDAGRLTGALRIARRTFGAVG
jgi:hypothetical protein